MAHTDWTNSSSRVIKAKAIARAYDSFSATFTIGKSGESLNTNNNGNCHITIGVRIGGNSKNVAKYIQITGNKVRNEYPIDFTITNARYYESNGEELFEKNISGNNSTDCIIDFKEYSVPREFDIVITKWSKPNCQLQEDSITLVSPNIEFDLIECGMLSSFETDIGLPYDGTNQLQYGIKTSSDSIELTKDLKNTGVQTLPLSDAMFSTFEYGKKYTYGWNEYTQARRTWSDKIVEDGIAGILESIDDNYNSTSGTYLSTALLGEFRSTNYKNVIQNHVYFAACSLNSNVYYLTGGTKKNYVTKNMRVTFEYGNGIHDEFVYDTTQNNNNQFYYYSTYYKYTTAPSGNDPVALSVRANTIYGQITNDKQYYYNVRVANIVMLDLTDLYGEGSEPTKDWCDHNIVYNSFTNTLTIAGKSYIVGNDIGIITRSEMLTKLDNKPYIEFSMALDSEFNYTKIGNYFIDSVDYDENSPKFTARLKDNTKLLEENELPQINVNDINITGEGYVYKSINKLFNNYINNQLELDLDLQLDQDISNDISINTATYASNMPYSVAYNRFCEALGAYIIQDITNIHRIKFLHYSKNDWSTYNINTNQCVSFQRYNKVDNAITNVSVEAREFDLSNAGEIIQYTGYDTIYPTRLEGYIDETKDADEDIEIHNSASISYPLLISKLDPAGNTITGTITIPLSEYNSHSEYYIELYGARAKYTCDINLAFITSQTGVPSGTNDETKNYIKEDGSIVTSISNLSDNDFNKIKWVNSSYVIRIQNSTVYFDYSLSFRRVNDAVGNSKISQGLLTGEKIEEEYLGAYKVVLTGYDYSSKSTTFNYTNGQGNTYKLSNNEFVQIGGKYIDRSTTYANAPLVYDKIASKILEEYGHNKKIVKLEWVGSPYIKIFDLIVLDNSDTYRVHYIRNKYDGGYRQVLYLVQED